MDFPISVIAVPRIGVQLASLFAFLLLQGAFWTVGRTFCMRLCALEQLATLQWCVALAYRGTWMVCDDPHRHDMTPLAEDSDHKDFQVWWSRGPLLFVDKAGAAEFHITKVLAEFASVAACTILHKYWIVCRVHALNFWNQIVLEMIGLEWGINYEKS